MSAAQTLLDSDNTMADIIHQQQQQRFVFSTESHEAVLEYKMLDDNRIDFVHTFVPPECRGQGVAEKLVRSGLRWARQQQYNISASCWYVAKFIR